MAEQAEQKLEQRSEARFEKCLGAIHELYQLKDLRDRAKTEFEQAEQRYQKAVSDHEDKRMQVFKILDSSDTEWSTAKDEKC